MTDSTEMDICESLTQWVEVIRAPNNAWLTLVDIALIDGECVSVDMEKAIVEITKLRAERDAVARDMQEQCAKVAEARATKLRAKAKEQRIPTTACHFAQAVELRNIAGTIRALPDGVFVIATEEKTNGR